MATKEPKHRRTKEETECLNEIYRYVQEDVLHYDGNVQKLGKREALRIQGLRHGKFIANNNTEDMSDYPFDVILNTFKFCQPAIQKALATTNFKDESHKFNYIMKIVESKLNDVYLRMKSAEKAKSKMDRIAIEIPVDTGADYQKKTDEKSPTVSKRLKDLW